MTDEMPEAPVQFDKGVASADPFGGDSQRFTWPREVSVGQLQIEVTAELGDEVRIAVIAPTDADGAPQMVDAQNPLVFYVTPSSADLTGLRRVLGAHQVDPYFGMDDEGRRQAQLREKIQAGAELTAEEMQQALRLLIA
jgi:hypothetical protein